MKDQPQESLEERQIESLLRRWQEGDEAALEQLMPMLYGELKQLAARQLRGERRDHTLQTTGLVHEAYVKLARQSPGHVLERRHFFALAAKAMRQVLIDHARKLEASKRLSPKDKFSLEAMPEDWLPGTPSISGLLDLDAALQALEAVDARASHVVELIYFVGLDQAEVAEVLETSERTVRRLWRAARIWLYDYIQERRSP